MRACTVCGTSTNEPGRFCPECGAALPRLDDSTPTANTVELAAARPTSLIGETIDGFAIESVIGGGAFGTVYRGRQTALDRPVALKVPTHEIAADPVMARRFAREARAAARVSHPGVVAIYGVGELRDGRPYLAMEHIDGEPLDRILAEGPVPAARALAIVRLIASTLSETHAAEVVHRDLKPSNVVWRRDRHGDDRITLVDFGIAVCKPGNADATRLTAGGLVGTPHYMSPEQAHGDAVDARADLYALGCILFELVTGTPPFEGSGFEVLLAHLGRPPPAASERNPAVPAAIDDLVLALMAKRPDDRPQTADEVVAMIDRAAAELEAGAGPGRRAAPVLRAKRPTPMTTRDRALPRPRRKRWIAAAAIAAVSVSVAGFAAIRYHATRDDGPQRPGPTRPSGSIEPGSASSPGPGKRQIISDDNEMAVRATLTDPIVAGRPAQIEFELWGGMGAKFTASQVVITIEDAHGVAKGFAAASDPHAPGRYRLDHTFADPGHYVIRVFPPEGASVFQFELEVAS